MTLCPVALAVGCRKCPIFARCPVKGIIGDYKKEEAAPAKAAAMKAAPAKTARSRAKTGSKGGAKKRR